MTLGITVGKFYPFHRGHDYLITEAKKQVDELVVLLGARPGDVIAGAVRVQWIRSEHPDVEVIEVVDDLPEAPAPWAERALTALNGRRPNLAFTSEAYGTAWAEAMGARHVAIDPERAVEPISGTELRSDLATHWDMLTPPVKAHFAVRVCVIGVESSGTTTLATSLAEHYQTVWVPEFGRYYWEAKRYSRDEARWTTDEFVSIARGQAHWEDTIARLARRLVVCDTDPLATHVWHRRYLGSYSQAVEVVADSRHYDLYLLTEPDFDFVQDGTREEEDPMRERMYEWLVEVLETKKRPFIQVAGAPDARLADAAAAIDPLLRSQAFFPVDSDRGAR